MVPEDLPPVNGPWVSLKGVIINNDLQILHETQVQFDTDLPEFRTHGGVVTSEDGHTITAPTLLWVKALDLLLDQLKLAGADYTSIAAISGTAQQHGSVYWQRGARHTLQSLEASKFLHEQLARSFSTPNSPVWMDSSTTAQCRQLEQAVGGAQFNHSQPTYIFQLSPPPVCELQRKLAEITGSTAYERFTASQIAKLSQTKPSVYNSTELAVGGHTNYHAVISSETSTGTGTGTVFQRISLVSSFACSLFLGDYADIDYSDGSGMNLLDIHSKEWSQICLDATAPNLIDKLGTPVASSSIQGPISQYFVERFDFNPDCKVASFTGDNPASLIGMCLTEGNIAVSLGTSDTLFLWLRSPQTLLEGHILCNPVDKEAYMALLCFKNGSLTRERVRDDCAEGSWELFNELLDSTPRGNFGNMGLYFDVQEIIPFVKGDHRFNKANDRVHRFTSMEVEVRALVEGQFLAKRAHAEDLGFNIEAGSRIIATGGASNNKSILQVLSDVFNAPVFVLVRVSGSLSIYKYRYPTQFRKYTILSLQEAANSAMLGSAYQAKHALVAEHTSFSEMTSCLPPPVLACQPYKDAAQVYNPMLARYRRLVKSILDTT
ncbi:unnamed protein product [Timema podura]|uniref:Xylulose kinase n=1 Tax=Timema podura TaxID=61482 RepID=A0ABN7NK87_TIMPD|nr:unnamed protein product [Timema podura]